MKKDIKQIIKRVIVGVLIVLIVGSLKNCSVKAEVVYNIDNVINDIDLDTSYHGSGSVTSRFLYNDKRSWSSVYSENITVGNHSPIDIVSVNGDWSTTFSNPYYIKFKYVDKATNSILYTYFIFYRSDNLPEYVLDRVDLNISIDSNTSLANNLFTFYSHPKNGSVDDITSTEQWNFYSYSYSTYLDSSNSFIGVLNDLTYDTLDTYVVSEYNNNLLNFYFPVNEGNSYNDIYRANPVYKEDFFTTFSIDSTNVFVFLVNGEDITHRNDLHFWWEEGNDSNSKDIATGITNALGNNVVGKYIEFITLPFRFLNSLTSSTCSPITLPIPFVNNSITLNCISNIFKDKVNSLYNIIFIVVNGLLVFRITMKNIDTITDVLKADDDKIEVVDL